MTRLVISDDSETHQICVVTPVYTSEISDIELRRIQTSIKCNLAVDYFFVGPVKFADHPIFMNFPNVRYISFPNSRFESVQSYIELMLDVDFYNIFKAYEAMVICQLDAILIREVLPLLALGFDYIGAPWLTPFRIRKGVHRLLINDKKHFWIPSSIVAVGNGGLSYRNIKSMISVLQRIKETSYWRKQIASMEPILNEDVLISYFLKLWKYKVAPVGIASKVFLEETSKGLDLIPPVFGFHALDKYNPILEQTILNSDSMK